MEVKFLESLGLEKEVIAKIQAESGKTIEKYKAQAESAKAELDGLNVQLIQRDKDLENLKQASGESEALKASLAQLQAKYEEDTANLAKEKSETEFSYLLKEKLGSIKAKDIDVVKRLIDIDGLKVVDGEIIGLNEQVEKLKADKNFLFNSAEKAPSFATAIGGRTPKEITQEQFKTMGYTQRLDLHNSNPELYKQLKGE